MRQLGRHERDRAEEADAESDEEQQTLWWENDPQLQDRFGR
ncbi:hypothetical protein MHPYR_210017 [uncultured Mycobacterium sp.]|uniref:Uncharacterized protein n=1 Tax=uncultured Mycobacterium sp. TaxID=171292 RepID=A0A1Y5P964_9MYCO|nr:hypothetical protein MHPYR_210017 [uncultured Mycobacterium sp.]